MLNEIEEYLHEIIFDSSEIGTLLDMIIEFGDEEYNKGLVDGEVGIYK
jgi:hypothetical protein